MYAFFINLINAIIRGLGAVLQIVLSFLPNSPFSAFIKSDSTVSFYLKYINYFIPVVTFIEISSAVLLAIGIYNVVQIIARWVKLIE